MVEPAGLLQFRPDLLVLFTKISQTHTLELRIGFAVPEDPEHRSGSEIRPTVELFPIKRLIEQD